MTTFASLLGDDVSVPSRGELSAVRRLAVERIDGVPIELHLRMPQGLGDGQHILLCIKRNDAPRKMMHGQEAPAADVRRGCRTHCAHLVRRGCQQRRAYGDSRQQEWSHSPAGNHGGNLLHRRRKRKESFDWHAPLGGCRLDICTSRANIRWRPFLTDDERLRASRTVLRAAPSGQNPTMRDKIPTSRGSIHASGVATETCRTAPQRSRRAVRSVVPASITRTSTLIAAAPA